MTAAYLTAFGLREAPFSKEVTDDTLWLPPSRQTVVDALVDALADREQVLLVGEPGVGKTCELRALRHRIPQAGFRLTYCHNATLGRRDFYRQLCLALGLSPSATAAAVFYASPPTSRIWPRTACTPSSSSTKRTCSTRTHSITCTSC